MNYPTCERLGDELHRYKGKMYEVHGDKAIIHFRIGTRVTCPLDEVKTKIEYLIEMERANDTQRVR